MGFLADLFLGKKQKKVYQGGKELTDTYAQAKQLQAPDYRNLMGQIGGGTLASASKDYMTRVLGGEGQNVYESDAFKNFQQQTMGQTQERLGQSAMAAGAGGMLRGSGAVNMASNVVTDANRMLGAQGFQAQQAGLERQYGIAQFAPQMELQQQQFQGQLMGQGYQDILSKLGLQGNLASSINQMYGVNQRSGGLMKGLGSIAGTIFGGPLGGALMGNLMPKLFGNKNNNAFNPTGGWQGTGR
jgi:hypothetical protein